MLSIPTLLNHVPASHDSLVRGKLARTPMHAHGLHRARKKRTLLAEEHSCVIPLYLLRSMPIVDKKWCRYWSWPAHPW